MANMSPQQPFGYLNIADNGEDNDDNDDNFDAFPRSHELLDAEENQYLGLFFSQDPLTDNNDHNYNAPFGNAPPPNVHEIRAIPHQSQSQHLFPADFSLHYPNQSPYTGLRSDSMSGQILQRPQSYNQGPHRMSYPGMQSSAMPRPGSHSGGMPTSHTYSSFGNVPMVPIPNGSLIDEPLARLLPNSSNPNSLDADFAARLANVPIQAITDPTGRRESQKTRAAIHWGSDLNFGGNGYKPQHPREVAETLERLDKVTRHNFNPDPALVSPLSQTANDDQKFVMKRNLPDNDSGDQEDEEEPRPGPKRRVNSNNKKAAPQTAKSGKPTADGTPIKKRKTSATPRSKKQNLSDNQKRQNHIDSEQRRRDQIKQCYEDLSNLVPANRDCNHNKAAVLKNTLGFLEDMVRKDEELKRLLETYNG